MKQNGGNSEKLDAFNLRKHHASRSKVNLWCMLAVSRGRVMYMGRIKCRVRQFLKYSLMKTHAAVIVFSFVPPTAHSSSLPPGS